MAKLRDVVFALALSVALLSPVTSAWVRGGGRGGGGGGGMAPPAAPKQPNPALVADRQQMADAQKALDKAKAAYNSKVGDLQKEFKKKDEYIAAKTTVDDAQKEYDAARTALLAKMKSDNADYKAAVAKEAAAIKKLEQIRDTAPRDEIAAQSKLKLDSNAAVEKMERSAVEADATCTDAKKKLADAKKALDALEKQMNDGIGEDDGVKNLKQTMTAAQTNYDDARKKLQTDQATMPSMI